LSRKTDLSHPKYRADIDGLRAIAVLAVVCFHASPELWTKGGFIGVDIFFVISGFLITTIIFENLKSESFSFFEFYGRRIRRIFPALTIVLTITVLIGGFLLLPDERAQLGKHVAAAVGFVSNFVSWGESGYFEPASDTQPLLHLWSLGIEEQFYIIWPLVLWSTWKLKVSWLTTIALIGIVSFGLNIFDVQVEPAAAFYSPQTRFWELLVGSLLAYAKVEGWNGFASFNEHIGGSWNFNIFPRVPEVICKLLPEIASSFGIASIALGVTLISKQSLYPGTWALLPTFGTALIIVAGSEAWINRKLLANRVFVWFGLISYPLYLWHWPLLSFLRIYEGNLPKGVLRLEAVATSILLAWLTYRFVEKPIRSGHHATAKTVVLTSSLIAIGIIGYIGENFIGLIFAPSPMQQILILNRSNRNSAQRAWRYGSCFLNSQDYKQFGDCGVTRDKNKKTILIWGDSLAADLYPGFQYVDGHDFNIIQRTAGGCPPLMEVNPYRYCKGIFISTLKLIEKEKPDRVVLSAAWQGHTWRNISRVIEKLKEIGIPEIDLVGPQPAWMNGLPKELYNYYKSDPSHGIPKRMSFGLNQAILNLDPILRKFATNEGINYISPLKIMCDQSGCLTIVGDTGTTLTTFDTGHLTIAASRYLVSHIKR
jgi:peptidoglycan/LPS O-acetylase OafA/YrhL